MLSTLITDTVKYYQLDEETVPYSGMYLVPKTGYTIEQAKDILESDAFYQYIQSIGIHANGKTYRISRVMWKTIPLKKSGDRYAEKSNFQLERKRRG
mgnify:CR=1 FL=1